MAKDTREIGRMQLAIKRLQALVGDTVTAFVRTLFAAADASAFLTLLGVSTFIKTLLDDTSAETARTTLGLDLIGMVVPTARTTAHTGWLLCYGQNVSRTTYAALFTAISTTYGVGDGSTTFGLPDLRGRVVAGQDDMGGSSANRLTSPLDGDVLGGAGGAESVTLTTAEMPSHAHNALATVNGQAGAGAYAFTGAVSINVGIQATGGGGAHANVQPTIILNYMIFAGA